MNSAKLAFALHEYLESYRHYGLECFERINEERVLDNLTHSNTETQPGPGNVSEPEQIKTLEDVHTWIGDCQRCRLCETRNSIVIGDGNAKADLVFVGEGPGADEDAKGIPFVGRAGQLLNKIIQAMGFERKAVYIANVVKCRPPQNRTPLPDEVEACTPFLKTQLEIIQPKIIVALGLPSATFLTGKVSSMGSLRGRFHPLQWDDNISIMPTYHPAYLLRNPSAKGKVWDDMKKVMAKLGKTPTVQ